MSDGEVMGRQVANPFGSREIAPRANGALISVEQQKAIAEVQARMIIARANPRDVIRATDLILQDCTRPTLAQGGLYEYARGGNTISGPSIRLAEAIASRWGNIASGIKEIARHDGYSECVAYAWDLESGYYDERQFQVRHWRDTNKGGYQLRDERDIYELIANMGQRRKRAVLLTVIPGDVVEAAVEQCEATLHATADTSPDALKKIVQAFSAYGVSQEAIEQRIQRRLESIRPAQIVQLRRIHASLKDGMSEPGDWFGVDPIIEAKVDTWRNEKEGKQTDIEFEDVGLDLDKLLAQGNLIVEHYPLKLEPWWTKHLSGEQRGVLGAKGRGIGPYLPQWKEGKQVVKQSAPTPQAQSPEAGEPPLSPSPPPPGETTQDSFGLNVDTQDVYVSNVMKAVVACDTLDGVQAIKDERYPYAQKHLDERRWNDLQTRIGAHETDLFKAAQANG